MRTAGILLPLLLLSAPASASDWKVIDIQKDAKAADARLVLKIETSGISVVRETDQTMVLAIASPDVMAIWYDDYALRNYGREWFDKMEELCSQLCGGEDLTVPLTLMAIGGAGYLAARPFEQRQHYVNIQYRKDGQFNLATLRTTWFDHFWVMTDLSQAVGRKWLNIPVERAKLYWRWSDDRHSLLPEAHVGKVLFGVEKPNVLLWEDRKGRGILMFFSTPPSGTPALLAAAAVTVEKRTRRNAAPEYCRSADDSLYLQRLTVGDTLATLPAAVQACALPQR
jgi:hypothetical protein